MKQEDDMLPLFFSLASSYVIRNFQENQGWRKLIGIHKTLSYAGGINLEKKDKFHVINTEILLAARKEISLAANTGNTKCILMSHQQNAWKAKQKDS
jgi:hypothetical protein